ncbi:MAG: fliF [Rhizobacter sp.]|nr:fliF [Rhizobacter sp.]
MDNAVPQSVSTAVATVSPQLVQTTFIGRIATLPPKRKISLGVGLAALVAVVIAMALTMGQGDYKVLYANLSDKDGGAILAALTQMNVPYKYADGGGAILVPADKVHDARLKLASAGLPKGSIVGFELMDNAKFGQTQFQERLTFQRGLEGELTRSITALSAVQGARVHLALPNQNGFFREQQKPTASVMLTLYPGRSLDRTQIAGIVHLVSSSVPEMAPKAVSVLDQTGSLLSGTGEDSNNSGLDAQQLAYVRQIEGGYSKRILDLLEPVVGRENLRAQVTAEIDFSQTESTSEEFKPNQGQEPATVRSAQSSQSNGGTNAQPSGVPGAATNQPQAAASAPITGPAQTLSPAQSGAGTSTGRRDSVTNYEVDKTVRVTRNASGNVKRLNAAVVVNHRAVTDAKGKTTNVPLSAEEIEKLTALVRESVGFNQARGDSVKVVNAPFQVDNTPVVETPLWRQPEVLDMMRGFALPGALALVALIVVFGLVRPAIRAAAPLPPPVPASELGGQLDAVVSDVEELPLVETRASVLAAARLESARLLAKSNPAAVAGIVRGWVAGEPA